MPKPHTFPTLNDNCKTISISLLSKKGFLKSDKYQSGVVAWSENGNIISSIAIKVNTASKSPYIELDYKHNEATITYRVQLVSAPSNLGKGVVWYFVCPRTGKRCRKLYLADTYFYHRSAFRGCMYQTQTYSRKERQLVKSFEAFALLELLQQRNFKTTYKGKPTRQLLKLKRKAERVSKISLAGLLGNSCHIA